MEWVIPAFLTVVTAATPLVFAAMGELVVEKAGVLNLGVEGMMLVGAIAAFATVIQTDSALLAVLAALAAGAALAFLFGVLTLSLLTNQVATGLALTIFGIGLSALIGHSFVGVAYEGLPKGIPGLSALPFIGPLLFGHDALVYLSVLTVIAVAWFLSRTRSGMILRAVGNNHHAAHSIGYRVVRIRYLAVLFGGAMAGLGGAYLSLAYTPMWVEEMTAGRGWIALALVVFATWRPWRVLVGAYLFGGITIIQLNAQGFGVNIPSQFLSALPYIATILVLAIISRDEILVKMNKPECLGKGFHGSS